MSAEAHALPDSEADSLRAALTRLEQDNYALQQMLCRTTEARDYWRNAYYEKTRDEK